MTNKKQINGEKLAKFVKETPKEVLRKLIVEAMPECMYELCMENLKEKDCALKLTGKCKKCYDYAAEQFILNYINGKSMFDVMDDIRSGKFYNTWLLLIGTVKGIVKDGWKNKCIENIIDIINRSRISRKTWMKFVDQLERTNYLCIRRQ